MTRSLFILSPCGTSLLTSGVDQNERSAVFRNSNVAGRTDIHEADLEILDTIISRAAGSLERADLAKATRLSAELNGIMAIYNNCLPRHPARDFHQLLCTDTWLGEVTGNLVRAWLQQHGFNVVVRKQKDLQTADIASFQIALSDMVSWIEKEIPDWREQYHVIFNLTGGFKSVQGFLQTLAMFYADETVYIFETTSELMRIPRLPVKMTAPDVLEKHYDFFRRLYIGIDSADSVPSDVPDTLLLAVDDQCCLSPWGELIWERNRSGLYSRKVYDPPVANVKFGSQFVKSTDRLPPDRIRQLNERIDDLCRFWNTRTSGNALNPVSLDFKELKGNPVPPSTHECDAWADQGGKRIFIHIEQKEKGDRILVLDRLGQHLK